MTGAVLVTGAAGFIGRAACPALESRGWRVVKGTRENGSLERGWPLRGIETVVHLAGIAHQLRGQAAESVYHEMNCAATERLARAAAQAGVKRFIFVSSIKVNGERTSTHQAFSSQDAPQPEDRYGRSKLGAEHALARIAAEMQLETVIIRPPLVYGPGVKANFRRLIALVRTGLPLPFASIDNRRSLLYVGNLADLVATCMRHPAAAGAILTPADGEALSTPRLVEEVGTALGRRVRMFPFPPRLLPAKLVESLVVDWRSSRQLLQWTPPYSVAGGLRKTISA